MLIMQSRNRFHDVSLVCRIFSASLLKVCMPFLPTPWWWFPFPRAHHPRQSRRHLRLLPPPHLPVRGSAGGASPWPCSTLAVGQCRPADSSTGWVGTITCAGQDLSSLQVSFFVFFNLKSFCCSVIGANLRGTAPTPLVTASLSLTSHKTCSASQPHPRDPQEETSDCCAWTAIGRRHCTAAESFRWCLVVPGQLSCGDFCWRVVPAFMLSILQSGTGDAEVFRFGGKRRS